MMDPRRLREQGASPAERLLLDSARNDEPPDGAARQMLASLHALGGQGSGTAAPHAGAGTIKAATAGWLKIGGLAMVGIVGLGVAGVVVHARAVRQPVARQTVPSKIVEPAASEADQAPPAPAPVTAPTPPTETPPAPSPAGEAGRARRTIPAEPSLAAELRFLDLVRTALDAHDPAAAQRTLDGYRRRFPHGRLEPEATVLRLEVLLQQGKAPAARSLGARLLADDGYRTYRTRIRSLLQNANAEPAAP